MLQHGLSIRWCVMAGCKEHWQNWKWDACVCVLRLWNCPDLCVNNSPTALCYAANQCGSVPGNSKYLCLPRLRFSHCFFFPSSCSFCLALLMLCIHITVQHENANYIFKTPCYIIAYLVVENWFFQRSNLQRERADFGGKNCQDSRKEINSSHCKKVVQS